MAEHVGPTAAFFSGAAVFISTLMIIENGLGPFIVVIASLFGGMSIVKAVFGKGGD